MSVQGQLLEITVIGCGNLKDTEWISRQDPYVILQYASNKYRTRTDTDGGRNPTFNEKYMLPLIEGLKQIDVAVWNSNTLSADDFIGSGTILLQKVLTEGYHDCTWPLTARNGRRAGEVRVILHYRNPKNSHSSAYQQHAPPLSSPAHYSQQAYATPSAYPPSQPHGGYPPAYSSYPSPGHSPYPPYGAGLYGSSMPHGSQSPYNHPPQSYPPQAYSPYPPQGHSSPYPAPYPPPY